MSKDPEAEVVAKVADFGLARVKAQTLTMTGQCGTVQWMAPEVLASERYAEPAGKGKVSP